MQQDTTQSKRILVVEDERSARDSIRLLLSIDRHSVAEAREGREALALAAKQKFDLVVLDYALPGMLGGEVARQLQRLAPATPILMISAFYEKLNVADLPGVCTVLGKPFAVEDLRAAVARLTA
ncbi:MAG TPA: response regulator [Verrucomicrobiota bacterium]|jgi:CheY-like chemotaxis protein|nr:response regulator [Verrucomicrobiota bacterium]OQB90087.1 MAG: Response regulator MprA [Verrucomicrobia bacterium ADurb.Bin118]HPY30742.1 response regulator [Verrucomicrobiota bacterium]HQB17166.1 response regulator [Verrucomicrobiota bacterium]